MLSTIGRAAIRRIGGGSASTNRALQSLWTLQRVESVQNPSQTTPRCYATATKTVAKPKAKAAAKPKPKAKKVVVKKVAKKKTAPTKKKLAVKKKPVVKKKVARPKKKVVLTEAQKLKAEIKVLKEKALLDGEPTALPSTAWSVVMTEEMKAAGPGLSASARMPAVSAKYKSLDPSELEAYNHTANQNKIANDIALKKWVESHTPDEINTANNARRLLKKRTNTRKYRLIPDDRQPKKPLIAMMAFMKERYASGDLKGVGDLKTVTNLLMEEWKALSESEKKPYEDTAAADKARYIQEYKTVFKRESSAKL